MGENEIKNVFLVIDFKFKSGSTNQFLNKIILFYYSDAASSIREVWLNYQKQPFAVGTVGFLFKK